MAQSEAWLGFNMIQFVQVIQLNISRLWNLTDMFLNLDSVTI